MPGTGELSFKSATRLLKESISFSSLLRGIWFERLPSRPRRSISIHLSCWPMMWSLKINFHTASVVSRPASCHKLSFGPVASVTSSISGFPLYLSLNSLKIQLASDRGSPTVVDQVWSEAFDHGFEHRKIGLPSLSLPWTCCWIVLGRCWKL